MIARFVTATGTGLGKTLVTAALCHQLRAQGRPVTALKPIVTGLGAEGLAESDPAILLRSLGAPAPRHLAALDGIAPFRFEAPLAPSMAAAQEGRRVDLAAVAAFCKSEAERTEICLIEGVGGVMVPLGPGVTVLDWIAALGAPAILVAGSYLGTLSHSLTALAALRSAGVAVAGVVVSETADATVGLADTVAELASWTAAPVLALPRLAGPDPWRHAPDLTALLSN